VQQAEDCDTEPERRQAVIRMLEHYLHTAEAAARAICPGHYRLASGSPADEVTPEEIGDCDQALAWFGAEHEVLLSVIRQAATTGFEHYAVRLPQSLAAYLDGCGRWQDMAASLRVALACSQRLGDLEGQAWAHRNLGGAHLRLDENDLAFAHLRKAAGLFERLGDLKGEANVYLQLSLVYEQTGQLRRSLSSNLRALELANAVSHSALRASACNNIGWDYAMLGDFAQALKYCQQALDEHRRSGNPSQEANTWDSLGYVYHQLGDYHKAKEGYRRALGVFHDRGSRYLYATTLSHLGDTHYTTGDNEAARDTWQQALAIFDELPHSDASGVRVKLDDLQSATRNYQWDVG
jgi:tetratricopeptide (TPR) repeat protein